MKYPLLEGIRKRAGILTGASGLVDDVVRAGTNIHPLVGTTRAIQPSMLTGVRRFVGKHPLLTLGAGGAGGYMLANRMGQGKSYQQGSEDMMRQMGPYAASMNAPQGAMGMPAWARPPSRRM